MSGCSDGHSRQFAFVGFKTTEVAQVALDYFNRSYLDSSRMAIEVSPPPPLSFSRGFFRPKRPKFGRYLSYCFARTGTM